MKSYLKPSARRRSRKEKRMSKNRQRDSDREVMRYLLKLDNDDWLLRLPGVREWFEAKRKDSQ